MRLIETCIIQTGYTPRGVIDASKYKDYILVMLFLKYISDLAEHQKEINQIEAKLIEVRGKMTKYLKELDVNVRR